jgi:circadian clock protein KaiC
LAFQIQTAGQEENVRMVYLDSLNRYMHAIGEERSLNLQLHELLTYLNQQGVITILVLSRQGLLGQMQTTIDLNYLGDTVVAPRFFELHGAVHKAISAINKRTGKHKSSIRELTLDPSGIKVSPPLENFHGILSGVPTTSPANETKIRLNHGEER